MVHRDERRDVPHKLPLRRRRCLRLLGNQPSKLAGRNGFRFTENVNTSGRE